MRAASFFLLLLCASAGTANAESQEMEALFWEMHSELFAQDMVEEQFAQRLGQRRSQRFGANGAFDPRLSVGAEASPRGDYDDRRAALKLKQKLPYLPIDISASYQWGMGQSVYDGKYTTPELGRSSLGLSVDALRILGARPETLAQREASIRQALESQSVRADRLEMSLDLLASFVAWIQADLSVIAIDGLLNLDRERVKAMQRQLAAGMKNRLDLLDATRRLNESLSLHALWLGKREAYWQKMQWWRNNPRPAMSSGDTSLSWCSSASVSIDPASLPEVEIAEQLTRLAENKRVQYRQLRLPKLTLSANISRGFGDAGLYGKFVLNDAQNNISLPYKGYESTRSFDFWVAAKIDMPLLNRKARFAYRASQQKMAIERSKARAKEAKSKALVASLSSLAKGSCESAERMGLAKDDARAILKGEQRRYEEGDVSLFQALQRESKALEIELKHAKLVAESAGHALTQAIIAQLLSEDS